jgi:hypothetical protein
MHGIYMYAWYIQVCMVYTSMHGIYKYAWQTKGTLSHAVGETQQVACRRVIEACRVCSSYTLQLSNTR